MKPQTPRIGNLVAYKLTEADVDQVNRRRTDAAETARSYIGGARPADGTQVHVGNPVAAGDVLPLIVTRVTRIAGPEVVQLDDAVAAALFKEGIDSSAGVEVINGQVFLDGNDTLWVTNRFQSFYQRDGEPHVGCWARLQPAQKTVTLPTVRARGVEDIPAHTNGAA